MLDNDCTKKISGKLFGLLLPVDFPYYSDTAVYNGFYLIEMFVIGLAHFILNFIEKKLCPMNFVDGHLF